MYYQTCITELCAKISTIDPAAKPVYLELKFREVASFSYILWMCEEVKKMDTTSLKDAVKAGRWIGWVFAHVELRGILNNNETRDLVRQDRIKGLDQPH